MATKIERQEIMVEARVDYFQRPCNGNCYSCTRAVCESYHGEETREQDTDNAMDMLNDMYNLAVEERDHAGAAAALNAMDDIRAERQRQMAAVDQQRYRKACAKK